MFFPIKRRYKIIYLGMVRVLMICMYATQNESRDASVAEAAAGFLKWVQETARRGRF